MPEHSGTSASWEKRNDRVQERMRKLLEPDEHVRAAAFGRTGPLAIGPGIRSMIAAYRVASGKARACGLVLTDRNLYCVAGGLTSPRAITETIPLTDPITVAFGPRGAGFPVTVNGELVMYVDDVMGPTRELKCVALLQRTLVEAGQSEGEIQ